MKLLSLIPTIFYSDIKTGKRLFVDELGFAVVHEDTSEENTLCILKKDTVKVHLVQDAESAKKDRPEIRIETDDIEALYQTVQDNLPEMLHPNLNKVKSQPWGLKEFALLDTSGVCVIIQQ